MPGNADLDLTKQVERLAPRMPVILREERVPQVD